MESQSHYIYMLKVTRPEMLTVGPTPEESEILGNHFSYLKDLAGKGTVLLAGRTQTSDESTFGLVIFEAGTEEEARGIMNRDPAVAHGVMHSRLYPYRVACKSSNF